MDENCTLSLMTESRVLLWKSRSTQSSSELTEPVESNALSAKHGIAQHPCRLIAAKSQVDGASAQLTRSVAERTFCSEMFLVNSFLLETSAILRDQSSGEM